MLTRFWRLVTIAVLLGGPARLAAQDDFEAFKKKEAEKLQSFISKDDSAFANFLKQDWKEFQLSRANQPLVRPKPKTIPTAPPAPAPTPTPAPAPAGNPPASATPPSAGTAPPATPVPLPVTPVPLAAPPLASTTPPKPSPRPVAGAAPIQLASANSIGTAFYGSVVQVPNVDLKLQPLPATITGEAIGAFWEQISRSKFADVLSALQKQRELMQLGDWAFAQLAFRTGLRLVNNDTMLARLVAWHTLIKSGYIARVGYNASGVYVLLKSDDMLYGASYFTFGGSKFYVLDLGNKPTPRVGSIYTYDRDHPEAKKALNFTMAELPILPEDAMARTLHFTYKQRSYDVKVAVNKNLVGFLSYYPQTQLGGYLDAEVPSSAMEAIVDGLRPIVAQQNEVEAVNIILRFVQTAFEYKTDGDQFGREKWMFPEETLFYPYSDCEDRAILFAYLVRKLTTLDVVGLIYSDHVATAVKFNTAVPGDSRMYNGQRYVVSDPTYINADVGMEMPQYKDASPDIVPAHKLPR